MGLLMGVRALAVDTETTGMSPEAGHGLVEVAHVEVADGALGGTWASLLKPGRAIPPDATRVHGITDAMVAGAPEPASLGPQWRAALADHPLVFHNAPFDLPFLLALFRDSGAPTLLNPIVDTLGLARGLPDGAGGNSLQVVRKRLGLPEETAHRALGDALTTARVFIALAERWERDRGIRSLSELAAVSLDVMRTTGRRS